MKLVISKTPLRISLFGGGTDLKSYYKKQSGGAAMSFAINKFLYVILKKNEKVVDYKYRINWSKTEFTNNINKIKHPNDRETFKKFKINFPVLSIANETSCVEKLPITINSIIIFHLSFTLFNCSSLFVYAYFFLLRTTYESANTRQILVFPLQQSAVS